MASSSAPRPVTETLKQYGRAVAGGLLFAVAAIYTMEIWWLGYVAEPHVVLVTFTATLFMLTAYAHYSGMRSDKSLGSDIAEALEALTLGFLVTVISLKLIGQLPPDASLFESTARIVMVGVNASIGVAVGTTQLGADPDEGESAGDTSENEETGQVGHEIALAILGAVLIGSGVAPTEEVLMISVEAQPWQMLVLAILSFAIALGVISYTNFRGGQTDGDGVFAAGPFGDACVTYGIALLVSLAMLWSAARLDGMDPLSILNLTVTLALPCALGASAGRSLL